MTCNPLCLAHDIAWSSTNKHGPTKGSPLVGPVTAQYPKGILTAFKPAVLMAMKSAWDTKVSLCQARCSLAAAPMPSHKEYSHRAPAPWIPHSTWQTVRSRASHPFSFTPLHFGRVQITPSMWRYTRHRSSRALAPPMEWQTNRAEYPATSFRCRDRLGANDSTPIRRSASRLNWAFASLEEPVTIPRKAPKPPADLLLAQWLAACMAMAFRRSQTSGGMSLSFLRAASCFSLSACARSASCVYPR
mmetsp:Transcript_62761/g.144527  ORF Transcript_62761/g.144527 Transcript_62761/m.144527 type:complete len:246 (-) Transcript_62761:691-1428(-)